MQVQIIEQQIERRVLRFEESMQRLMTIPVLIVRQPG
jgi:hypothetical protein